MRNPSIPSLTRPYTDWCCRIAPPDDPVSSILLHPAHAKAPPEYTQVCCLDPLRDEGILYAKVLEEAGVQVKFDVYDSFHPDPFNAGIDLHLI